MNIAARKKSHFSLVEVLAAMVVATAVMAASISFLSFQRWTSDSLNRRMTAVSLGKNRIEIIKRLPFSEIPFYAESDVRINTEGQPDDAGQYLRSVVVGDEQYGTRLIQVTVRSPGRGGRPEVTIPLATIIRDPATLEN